MLDFVSADAFSAPLRVSPIDRVLAPKALS